MYARTGWAAVSHQGYLQQQQQQQQQQATVSVSELKILQHMMVGHCVIILYYVLPTVHNNTVFIYNLCTTL